MGLKASDTLDSPPPAGADGDRGGGPALPALHIACMAPFSTLNKHKCLELAKMNFHTAAKGLRSVLLRTREAASQRGSTGDAADREPDASQAQAASYELSAAIRAKHLLALLWRKLGDASNELGQHNIAGGDLALAEGHFEDALAAFDRVDDAENCAIMTLNLAVVLRRKAYADFVQAEHLTLSQRQLYVRAISLYERALASLGSRRRQKGESRSKRDGIASAVQSELAGTYTAFAQQLQAGGRVSRAEGSHAPDSEAGGQGESSGAYIVDEDVVPDLLRKALDIYTAQREQQPAKLCAVHAALGRHYVALVDEAVHATTFRPGREAQGRQDAKRLRSKADRALSHLQRSLAFAAPASSQSEAEGRATGGQCGALLMDLHRLHRLVMLINPACGITHADEEAKASLHAALGCLQRIRPLLQNATEARGDDDAESELRSAVLTSARETLRDLTKVTSASTNPVGADGAAAAARYKGAYRTALVCTAENVEALLEQIAGIESGR